MTRLLLSIALAVPLFADAPPARDTIRKLAESLTDDNEVRFLRLLDPAAPDELFERATALIRQNEVSSSIVILSEEGEGATRLFRLDWLIDARPRSFGEAFQRRRAAALVEVILDPKKNRWRVKRIEPLGVLDPPPMPRP